MEAVKTKKIVSIEIIPNEDVYDITVNKNSNFVANDTVIHNCGELPICENDSCRLLCQNLLSSVIDPFTKKAKLDLAQIERISEIGQRLMDDLVDLELEQIDKIIAKIIADPEPANVKAVELQLWQDIKTACFNGRRTGLGITALGDAIAALGVKYGSKESIQITDDIYRAQAIGSYRMSCILAKERGAFPIFDHALEKNHPFLERIWEAAPDVYALYKKHGRRNIANTTTAPTGSVSTMTQTTSGIEPAFLPFYTRWKKITPNDKNQRVDRVDAMGDKWQAYPVFHHHFKTWMDLNGHSIDESKLVDMKSPDDLDFYKDSPFYKATSNDVDWIKSVELQAAAQKWVCHAISKTCNVPQDCTEETIGKIYMKAWKSGCKGFTVYRDKCRDGVLVSNAEKKETLIKTNAVKRPKVVECDIHHTKSRGDDFFVLVGLVDGHPYEVFAGKNGHITQAKKGKLIKNKRGDYQLEVDEKIEIKDICDLLTDEQAVITRIISLSLRHGSDITYVVDQLEKSPGDMTNFGKSLARVLKKYIKENIVVSGADCPQCKGSLIRQEGCKVCKDCGWSAC